MATSLLEAYKNRIAIAEAVYGKAHNGSKMDNHRKITIARVLKNTTDFLNEAFDSSSATQRSDLGLYKKFCLNLTNVALPNLIAHDLVMVHPMTSMSGYVTYIEYTAGVTKGQVAKDSLFNSPFKLGDGRANESYTSDRVVESFTGDGATTAFALAWSAAIVENGKLADGSVTVAGTATTAYTASTSSGVTTITFDSAPANAAAIRIGYVYDNIVIPQETLPTLKAEMKSIALVAKARRIAIYYSQMAAFQAKTDYGFDLGDQLAEKSVGELSYEIDTEITQLLLDNAATHSELNWSRTLPVGVSKSEHYEGFSEIVAIASQKIYEATRKFAATYMVIAPDILPVLHFIKGFDAAPAGQVAGPYFAGTLNGVKVFVTPNYTTGSYVVGCNGSDLMSSAAVYAPYMSIVPTQLLQYADGGTSQGFSTLYDLKLLNTALIVKGTVTA